MLRRLLHLVAQGDGNPGTEAGAPQSHARQPLTTEGTLMRTLQTPG